MRRRPGRWLCLPAVGALVAAALAGCVGPTVTDAGYRNKVAGTAKQISSAMASARLGYGWTWTAGPPSR